MKWLRGWSIPALLIVVLCTSIVITYKNLHLLEIPLRSYQVTLENINSAATDADGNTYVLDRQQRVLKWNPQGRIDLIMEVHDNLLQRTLLPRDTNQFIQLTKIKVDDQGGMYIARSHFSRDRTELQSEEILHYSSNGTPDAEPLYTKQYDPPLEHTSSQLTSMLVKQDALNFFEIVDDGLILHEVNLNDHTDQQLLHIVIPGDIGVQNVSGWQNGHVFFTGKNGLAYRVEATNDPQGYANQLEKLPQPDGEHGYNYDYRLFLSPRGNLYVTDIGARQVLRYDQAASGKASQLRPKIWLDEQQLRSQQNEATLDHISALSIGSDNRITIGIGDTVIQAGPNLENLQTYHDINLSGSMLFKVWLVRICLLTLLASFVLLLRYVYIHVMKRKVSVLIKQMVAFMVVLTALLILFATILSHQSTEQLQKQIDEKLKNAVYMTQGRISPELIQAIREPTDYMNEDFRQLRSQNLNLLAGSGGLDIKELYSEFYVYRNNQLYILTDYGDPVGPLYPQPLNDQYRRALHGEIVDNNGIDADGSWLAQMGPVYDRNNRIIGVHEIGLSEEYLNNETDQLFNRMFNLIVISAPLTTILFSILTILIMSSIRKLRAGAIEMAAGNWGTRVHIGGIRDEMSELGDQFNSMASQIEQHIGNIQLLSQSYYRFVPRSFLDFLDKKDLTEVQLGNQVQKEMSMMICSIRSFYRYTKGMNASQIFNLINLFLGSAGPRIRHAGGIVNDYADASLFSLFPRWCEDALEAALSIRQRVNEVNIEYAARGDRLLDIGVVIHRGSLLLGVVGEEERMANAVISEDVNVVFELERVSSQLGVNILLTTEVYQALEHPEHYGIRDLGYIQPGGEDHHMHLYELYDGDTEQQRVLKNRTSALFEQGVQLFRDGRFLEARSAFLQVIRKNGSDQAARQYFYLSDEYYSKGADEDWSGQLKIS